MEQDQAIRAGATASVIAHLSLLALLVLVSEVRPLDTAGEPVAVNIVTPAEIEAEPEKAQPEQKNPEQTKPEEKPPLQLALPEPAAPQKSTLSPPAAPAKPQTATAPKPQSPPQPPPGERGAPAAPPPKAQLGSASAGYRPAEPDLSVKYNVVLGLPPELPPPAVAAGKSEEGFDETSVAADIASSAIAAFRRHLKTCSKLPASVKSSDHIMVKLRVFLAQDGMLAADPLIGGGSANVKAIELLQGAIAGLKQCQPYRMLPADRYGEWKVLDLDFTPKDFSG